MNAFTATSLSKISRPLTTGEALCTERMSQQAQSAPVASLRR